MTFSYQSFVYSELQSIGQHSEIGFIFKIVRKLKILFKSNTQTSVPNFEASKNYRTFENRIRRAWPT